MAMSSTACPRSFVARRCWLVEVGIALHAYDRLTAKGMSERQAARRVGLDRATLRQMRQRSASLEEVFRTRQQATR